MAPKGRRSVSERLALAHQRTHKLSTMSSLEDCTWALKEHPELAGRMREFLATAGVDFSKKPDKIIVDEDPGEALVAIMNQPMNPLDVPTDEHDRIPPCDTALGLLKVDRLKTVLYMLDPVTFTEFTIKALAPAGRRQADKGVILQCIEVATNFDKDKPLNGVKSLHYLAELARTAADELGNRTARLRLPPDWVRDGIYEKFIVGSLLTVTHRFPETFWVWSAYCNHWVFFY